MLDFPGVPAHLPIETAGWHWLDLTLGLCLLVVAGCLIWSAEGMGYSRYGLYLEMLAGVTVVAVAASVLRGAWRDAALWRRAAASLLLVLLVAQAGAACVYAYGYEWSMRHNILHFREYRKEAKQFLRVEHDAVGVGQKGTSECGEGGFQEGTSFPEMQSLAQGIGLLCIGLNVGAQRGLVPGTLLHEPCSASARQAHERERCE